MPVMKYKLDTVCVNCRKPYGEHRCKDHACPNERYRGRSTRFNDSKVFEPLADWEVELLKETGHLK